MCVPYPSSGELMSYDATPLASVLRYWNCGGGGGGSPSGVPPVQLSAVAAPKVIRPGAPPVRVVSVTAIRVVPSCWKEIVEPTALSVSLVPAGSGPLL